VTAEGPMAVGWRCSNGLGRCVRQALVAGAPIQATRALSLRFGRIFRARHRSDPRPKDVMRMPFEERVNRCPSRPPGCVDEMSLRIARRGEGAAIDENGFALYRWLPPAGIPSRAWRFKPDDELPATAPWNDKNRYFPRALPEAIRRTGWRPISSADGDSIEREDCRT
jgi:hypothetical protein